LWNCTSVEDAKLKYGLQPWQATMTFEQLEVSCPDVVEDLKWEINNPEEAAKSYMDLKQDAMEAEAALKGTSSDPDAVDETIRPEDRYLDKDFAQANAAALTNLPPKQCVFGAATSKRCEKMADGASSFCKEHGIFYSSTPGKPASQYGSYPPQSGQGGQASARWWDEKKTGQGQLYSACFHKPVEVIDGKTWKVFAGTRIDCLSQLRGFDLIINLTGLKTMPNHDVPFEWFNKYKTHKATEIKLDWPDMDSPVLDPEFWKDLVKHMAEKKSKALVFCIGGHGRTGTAIACILVATGWKAQKAIDWIRTNYCSQAIETVTQENYIEEVDYELNNRRPRKKHERLCEHCKKPLIPSEHTLCQRIDCIDSRIKPGSKPEPRLPDLANCETCGEPKTLTDDDPRVCNKCDRAAWTEEPKLHDDGPMAGTFCTDCGEPLEYRLTSLCEQCTKEIAMEKEEIAMEREETCSARSAIN
jgi:hypothetical protein